MHTVFALLCFVVVIHWLIFPISIRLTSLALWQSNDCPSASKATLMNMDKYFMWIHYERLHNNNKAKHNKTVCIFLGIYCNWHHNDVTCTNNISVPLLRFVHEVNLLRMLWWPPIITPVDTSKMIVISFVRVHPGSQGACRIKPALP